MSALNLTDKRMLQIISRAFTGYIMLRENVSEPQALERMARVCEATERIFLEHESAAAAAAAEPAKS